jgi:N-acetylneuraminic acid mutarotase
VGLASASMAVMGTGIYVVGGCMNECASLSSAVYRYSTTHNTWTRVADCPVVHVTPPRSHGKGR